VSEAMTSNNAFESGRAETQRAFSWRPWRRAAQRERWASIIQLHNTINQEEKSICVTRP
jgi:hypothetical protein